MGSSATQVGPNLNATFDQKITYFHNLGSHPWIARTCKNGNTFHTGLGEFSIVSDYRLDDRGWIPGRDKDFSSNLCVQTGSEDYPASYPVGTVGKVRPGYDADHSPLSSAEVKNE
jgi:hypothetical protein